MGLVLEAKLRKLRATLIERYQPHQKQYDFHALGRKKDIRAFFGGNRTGKTVAGGVETAYHATGMYPDWWPGVRWNTPTRCWVASESGEVTRDVAQKLLMGTPGAWGTGVIPGRLIGKITTKRGIADCIDIVRVKHTSGGWSEVGFKSYDQKRPKFQGTSKHWIWFDEEPPKDIYSECMMRLMDVQGQMGLTMTPLKGMSDVCMEILGEDPDAVNTMAGFINASWEDNPHLSPSMIKILEGTLPAHEREARQYGRPTMGSGRIYPFPRSTIICEPFEIPRYWHRGAGIDFGWTEPTAVIWGAKDPDGDTIYLYNEHYLAEQPPLVHASSILSRGKDIPICGDPSGQSQNVKDGESLFEEYERHGVFIRNADNTIKSGVNKVFERLLSGRLKVFSTLGFWIREFELYHRNEDGKIVKRRDHLMDATRYLISEQLFMAPMIPRGPAAVLRKPPKTNIDNEFGGF